MSRATAAADIGAQNLDGDFAPVAEDGAMDLGDRGAADGGVVEFGEDLRERFFEGALERGADGCGGFGGDALLEFGEFVGEIGRAAYRGGSIWPGRI